MNRLLRVPLYSVFIIGVFVSSSFADALKESPANVVYQLYKDFAWEAVVNVPESMQAVVGETIANQSKEVLERYFDTNLSALLFDDAQCTRKAKGEICNLDFDPIFSSQDNAAYNLTIKPLESGDVGVEFIYPSDGKKIQLLYKMKKTDKGYRVSDIIYRSNSNSSLIGILKNNNHVNNKNETQI